MWLKEHAGVNKRSFFILFFFLHLVLVGGESLVNYLTCDSLSSFYGLGVCGFMPLSVTYWFVLDPCHGQALVFSDTTHIGSLEIGKKLQIAAGSTHFP